MARSQRQSFHIYPQNSQGGEMILPFTHYLDAIPMSDFPTPTIASGNSSTIYLAEMGSLVFDQVVPLTSTAAAQTAPVNVIVYAWAENVELFGPTAYTQAGEFEEALKPSMVASAIASAAGALSKLPVIGPFAMATQLIASGAAGILSLFGWSKPPVVTGVSPMRIVPYFMNPTSSLSVPDVVLALDPQCEKSIDPRIAGCSPEDTLNIAAFAARPAIIDVITWNASDVTFTNLATLPVSPVYARAQYITNATSAGAPALSCGKVTMTPATYMSQYYQAWRGTYVVHVKVVCSQFHRGRLQVLWDPIVNQTPVNREGTQIYEVLDISEATELTMRVPYLGASGLLSVLTDPLVRPLDTSNYTSSNLITWTNRTITTIYRDDGTEYLNGNVTINVLSDLQVANANSPAYVVLSTWFEDMEYFAPISDFATGTVNTSSLNGTPSTMSFANFNTQSADMVLPDESVETSVGARSDPSYLAKIYMGEKHVSFRSLMSRSIMWTTVGFGSGINLTGLFGAYYTDRLPGFYGPGKAAKYSASSALGYKDTLPVPGTVLYTYPINDVTTTPMTAMSACHVGVRGSVVWRAASLTPPGGIYGTISLMQIARTYLGITGSSLDGTTVFVQTGLSVSPKTFRQFFSSGLGGIFMQSPADCNVVGAVVPDYRKTRILPGNPIAFFRSANNNLSTLSPMLSLDAINLTVYGSQTLTGNGTGMNVAMAVEPGADFNVIGFVNVPDVYIAKSGAAPATL